MNAANLNSSDFTPDDIRWTEGRDPDRNWAITRQQPVASLLVSGALWGFSRSVPPPAPLIGRRLIVTAGGGHEPFKAADIAGMEAVGSYCGGLGEVDGEAEMRKAYGAAVHTLPVKMSVGAVRLAAAYQIGHVSPEGIVYADIKPVGRYQAPRQMGIWKEFDRRKLPIVEKLERGRWMWCFDAHHEFDLDFRVRMPGFAGIWDYEKGVALRRPAEAQQGAPNE